MGLKADLQKIETLLKGRLPMIDHHMVDGLFLPVFLKNHTIYRLVCKFLKTAKWKGAKDEQ